MKKERKSDYLLILSILIILNIILFSTEVLNLPSFSKSIIEGLAFMAGVELIILPIVLIIFVILKIIHKIYKYIKKHH